MKILSNLPGTLRVLFGFLRILTLILAVFWLLTISFNSWIQNRMGRDARLMASVGEILLPVPQGSISLNSSTATPGTLKLELLRGSLLVDLCSSDTALVSALRLSAIPMMAALIVFCFVSFTALRRLCANLERGDVFSEENLRLVRGLGLCLIVYSLVAAGLQMWASHILSGYFSEHVVMDGFKTGLSFTGGSSPSRFFQIPNGLLTTPGAVLVGCMVLIIAEAFRQGLNLKTENDLTI